MKIRLFTIPNLLTLANLACGSLAVVYALRFGDLVTAFWLIAAAALFDFLDGFAARMLKSYSELGKQLDSLCDMVSFGLAPSAILFDMYSGVSDETSAGFIIFILALFSALRLAKFNIDDRQTDGFIGLPTPAAGIFAAAAGWSFANGLITPAPWTVILTACVLALLLISPIGMFSLKFKNFNFRDNLLKYVFMLFSLTVIIVLGIPGIMVVIICYILTSAKTNILCRKRLQGPPHAKTS